MAYSYEWLARKIRWGISATPASRGVGHAGYFCGRPTPNYRGGSRDEGKLAEARAKFPSLATIAATKTCCAIPHRRRLYSAAQRDASGCHKAAEYGKHIFVKSRSGERG